jgi:hypothetical protein
MNKNSIFWNDQKKVKKMLEQIGLPYYDDNLISAKR